MIRFQIIDPNGWRVPPEAREGVCLSSTNRTRVNRGRSGVGREAQAASIVPCLDPAASFCHLSFCLFASRFQQDRHFYHKSVLAH